MGNDKILWGQGEEYTDGESKSGEKVTFVLFHCSAQD